MSDLDLIGVFLVSSGTRGDRLLFRYPYETEDFKEMTYTSPGKNPYAVRIEEDIQHQEQTHMTSVSNGTLVGYHDRVLANLLAVKADLCGRPFVVKINDVVFVGFPMQLHPVSPSQSDPKRDLATMISIHVAFALHANADEFEIACYHDLAKQLAIAMCHEEKRCGYLNAQQNLMWAIQDEVATMPEDSRESPFRLMLKRCQLAKQLKKVYEDLCNTGVVILYVNNWVHVNFCLPHKVHNIVISHDVRLKVSPEGIKKCLNALRPYHAVLLLVEENSLLESLPIDASPSLTRLIKVASPLKNLQDLASDADLSLGQVYQLVSHLVYWSKATIMYPLCESNVYLLAPDANTFVNSSLVAKFVEQFPGVSLPAVMAEFSLPSALGEHRDVLGLPQQHAQEVQMVVWMLQHRLLIQLHTYVFLMPKPAAIRLSKKSSESLLSPVEEDELRKGSSISDVASVNSDDSATGPTVTAKSPSIEVTKDGRVITSETRAQWRWQDSLLGQLPPADRASIMAVPAASNADDLKTFSRLCPYFNGNHHIEEVMYYENIRRSQLLTLLDKFRDVLVTCQHEDPGTSYWIHS